jgi:hypothetical protein
VADSASRTARSEIVWALAVFLILILAYNLNGDFLPGNDAKPNVYLALSVLEDGDLAFTPSEMPFMFAWHVSRGNGSATIYPGSWEDRVDGVKLSELRDDGRLSVAGEKYYIVPSRQEGRYVSMYGPGAGLTALPGFALARMIFGPLGDRPAVLWYTAKVIASILVAGSAAFLFLTLRAYTSLGGAALLSLAYGLGTGAWSTSSQTLWQHGPDVFFLSVGTYLFVRSRPGSAQAFACGLAYACAALCRPDSVLVVAAVGVYVLLAARPLALPYALGSSGPLVFLAAFNLRHFGSPLRFGQTVRALAEATAITGTPGAWSTPLHEGLGGLLVSPSRGLFVFSPYLALAAWGIVLIWRRPSLVRLRPLTVATVASLVLSSKWYYWWGGWSYGYRLIVDLTLLLTLFVAPTLATILRARWLLAGFATLVAWSVAVQFVGAFAYDLMDWNARPAEYAVQVPGRPKPEIVSDRATAERLVQDLGGRIVGVTRQDVNALEHRHRLWSVEDNQIAHYVRNFAATRRNKREMMERWLANPGL